MTRFKPLQELENFYDLLTPAQENTPEFFVWFSGIPHPLFNAIMHLKHEDVQEKVETLVSQAPQNLPFSFWVHSQNGTNNLIEVLHAKGFQPIATCPLMTWHVNTIPLPQHRIETANLDIFCDLLGKIFHFDEPTKESFANLLDNVVQAKNYILYHENQSIGTGTLVVNEKIGGVFNVGILPEYQKKGYGRAMMQFLMNKASNLGLDHVVLLSSPNTENFYSHLNFTKDLDIDVYVK